MKRFISLRYILAITGLCSVGGVYFATRTGAASIESEYPDAPFAKYPAGAICVIEDREEPEQTDKAAYEAHMKVRREMWARVKSEGSEKDLNDGEKAAMAALRENKYIKARKAAEKVLEENPLSPTAMYVRAKAMTYGDSNAGAALYQVRVLRHFLQAEGRDKPNDIGLREWYLRGLLLETEVLERLGRDPEVIRCVELMEQVFQPLPWKKTWPLMRLKRYEEAGASIDATEKLGTWPVRILNDRMCLFSQQILRDDTYAASQKNVAACPTHAVPHLNHGIASRSSFRFAEAEESFQKMVKHEHAQSRSTGYTSLAYLYVQEGRLAEAADALRKGRSQRSRRQPNTWQFDQASVDECASDLYLVSGKTADAERLARQIIAIPDRLGHSTLNERCQTTTNLLMLAEVLRCRLAEENESAGMNGTFTARKALQAELWTIEQKIAKVLDSEAAAKMLRPQIDDGPVSWKAPGLLTSLPTGVSDAILSQARAAEVSPAAKVYFDELEMELRFRQGRYEDVLNLSKSVIEGLPVDGEKLLRLRAHVIAAKAALSLGKIEDCVKFLDPALDGFPVALRMLDAAIPVRIEDDGSAEAKQLAEAIGSSGRFYRDPAGLHLSVKLTDGKLECELFRVTEAHHLGVSIGIENGDVTAAVEEAYRKFHERLMTPAVALDQTLLNGINGSPGAVRESGFISQILERPDAPKQ